MAEFDLTISILLHEDLSVSDVDCCVCMPACVADLRIFVRAHTMCMHVSGQRLHVLCFSGVTAFSEAIPLCR